jgi:hypothetical protein
VYHRAVYRCNRRPQENMHDRTRIERCRNSEIATHILEDKVFELIREIMLDPTKLRGCIDTGGRLDDQSIARELARIAGAIRALDEERRRLIGRYAAEQMAGEAYIAANRALDRDLERLVREKAELVAALRSPQHEAFVDASIRQYCASANARLESCKDFDTKRQFLLDQDTAQTGHSAMFRPRLWRIPSSSAHLPDVPFAAVSVPPFGQSRLDAELQPPRVADLHFDS